MRRSERSRVAYRAVWAAVLALVLVPAGGRVALASSNDGVKSPPFDVDAALKLSQDAIGQTVGNYAFVDTMGRPVRLRDLMDKPLVVSLIYTGCTDICPTVSQTLADAVDVARDALGKDSFRVVSIGFDARNDSPKRLRAYAAARGIGGPDWSFLSADAATIDRFARDLGFTFRPSPHGFDHMSQTTVIDPEGKVYRHVYGADFGPPLLVEPLKELVFGRRTEMTSIVGLINRVRLYCTLYDPSSGRYRFDYSFLISIVMGALSLGTIGTVLVRAWLGRDRGPRRA